MSSPVRSPGNRPSRRQRVDKAYNLTLATGGFGLATVVTFVLALFSSFSFGIVFLLAVVTAVLAFILSRAMR